MPIPAEHPQPPRRPRHVFRWVVLTLTVLLLFSAFALFKWGDFEKMPGFAKIWNLRGTVLYNQIRFGHDHRTTEEGRRKLGVALLELGSYRSAEKQYRKLLASEERVYGTNSPQAKDTRLSVAECLFLEGTEREVGQPMQLALKNWPWPPKFAFFVTANAGAQSRPLTQALGITADLYPDRALRLVRFELEQADLVFKEDAAKSTTVRRIYEAYSQHISNSPAFKALRP